MKTEEDEAFDELERRQGGGFPAKRAMAADKLQEPLHVVQSNGKHSPLLTHMMNKRTAPPAHCQCTACKTGIIHASDCAVHNGPAYPAGECDCGVAQEPVAWCIKYGGVLLYAEGSLSKKEVEGNFARNFNEGLSEIIPFYTTPPKRSWVGLTDEDIERIKLMTYEKETNADGEEQEAVNIDWLIKTAEHFCKEKNT